MPDIAMCHDVGCPMRGECRRYRVRPSEYQTFFVYSPRIGDVCEYKMRVYGDERAVAEVDATHRITKPQDVS
jgi:hypothetical protein